MRWTVSSWLWCWALSCLFASPALAQPSSQERALAETLFREAKKLAKVKKLDEACPKFAESQRLDPQLGTLLHLATCHEQQGKTASAWAEFSEAAELAEKRGDERAVLASQRAAELEPGLSRLTIRREPGAEPAKIRVRLDDREIGAAMLGTAMPVDPGAHELTATASGHEAWTRVIDVGEGDQQLTVSIGDLQARPTGDEPSVTPSTSSSLGTAGWAIFAVGGASLLVGAGLGIGAAGERDAADEECDGRFCTDAGLQMHDTSRDLATASTVTVIVGLVAMAAGITIVLAAPSNEAGKPEAETAWLTLAPTAGGGALLVGGAW